MAEDKFEVTRIQPVTIITDEGLPVPGRRVWYKVPGKQIVDYVEIPGTTFDAEAAKVKIRELVDAFDELTGGV